MNTEVPNLARIFDYLAGGSINYEIDRQAAEAMLTIIPSIGKWVRLRRAFIQEAASQLHAAGFRQFLDFGSGMPADDHIHAFAPDAHVVFSDLNPVAISYGQSILQTMKKLPTFAAMCARLSKFLLPLKCGSSSIDSSPLPLV
ncbi:MAG: hypothetical protein HC804_12560 [Anaerolineae bacterium]|nr:hypothetical protein [Anaerolineae bacterium]